MSLDLKQWRWGGGFEDFVVSLQFTPPPPVPPVPHPPPNWHHNTSNYSKIRRIFCRAKNFSNSFLLQIIREWKKLDTSIYLAPSYSVYLAPSYSIYLAPSYSIYLAPSYSVFRKALLDFIRPTANCTFRTNYVSGLKLLTRLCVDFNHLRQHKFKHNFQDTLNPLWSCSL